MNTYIRWTVAAACLISALPASARENASPETKPLPPIHSSPPAKAPPPTASRGELLYENHCTGCHTSVAHVRADHRAKSVADVNAWVNRWAGELKLGWNKDDVTEVTQYLARRYYKFGQKS